MESNAMRLEKEVKFRSFINQFLKNTEQDCDEDWWKKPEAAGALSLLAGSAPWAVSDSIELQMAETVNLVVAVWSGGTAMQELEQLTNGIRERFEKIVEKRKPAFEQRRSEAAAKKKFFLEKLEINFLFFARDFRSRVVLEKKYTQEIRDSLRRAAARKFAVPITTSKCTFIIYQEYRRELARIRGINRHESIQMPPISGKSNSDIQGKSEEESIRSTVVTVQLKQLVELYNQIGDQLFRNNVRLGISERFGVSEAMRRTLEEEPERFWFKNNGVTLLVEDPNFRLDCPDELQLGRLEAGGQPRFSVVNGAQTITISAKYAFEQEYLKLHDPDHKDLYEKRLENFSKAQVILRVIHVPIQSEQDEADDKKEAVSAARDLANDISVSLNRQKPVRQEDIAFSTPFVQKLTEYLSEARNNAPFQLIRRGEEISHVAQLNLVDFSRARLACANYPGKARTASSIEIMKIDLGTEELQNNDVFVESWMDPEADENAVFQRCYGAVWFADQIAKAYGKAMKSFKSENVNARTAVQNGKWYFTALAVQLLNRFKTDADGKPDFSAFDWSAQDFSAEIPRAMDAFSRMAVYTAGEGHPLDSNDFKSERYYQQMLTELKKEDRKPAFREFSERFLPMDQDKPPETRNIRLQKINAVRLGRENDSVPVKSGKEAFEKTVIYILQKFSPPPALLVPYDSWLTTDSRKAALKKGNFNSNSARIAYCGREYWIGSEGLSNDGKFSWVCALCRLAQVPQGEIAWFAGGEVRYMR